MVHWQFMPREYQHSPCARSALRFAKPISVADFQSHRLTFSTTLPSARHSVSAFDEARIPGCVCALNLSNCSSLRKPKVCGGGLPRRAMMFKAANAAPIGCSRFKRVTSFTLPSIFGLLDQCARVSSDILRIRIVDAASGLVGVRSMLNPAAHCSRRKTHF